MTGKPGALQPIGSPRAGGDLGREQQKPSIRVGGTRPVPFFLRRERGQSHVQEAETADTERVLGTAFGLGVSLV